jgi:hypothetical protein
MEAGNSRRLIQCCVIVWALGLAFLILKFGLEYYIDFTAYLFPGETFVIKGPLSGGAQLFFVFYFVSTALHGIHMIGGLVLVGWIILRGSAQSVFICVLYTGGCGRALLELCRHRVDYSLRTHLSGGTRAVNAQFRSLLATWILLLMLLAVEFGASFLPLGSSLRPLIVIPAVLMVAAVGTMFMQVKKGPTIVRLFVAAGLVWLSILLGLGSLDPMTRTDVYVQDPSQQ